MNEKLLNDEVNFMITNASKKELFDYIVGLKIQSKKYKEVIDKAISHLDLFISDTGLSKYDTLKILMHTKKILKEVD